MTRKAAVESSDCNEQSAQPAQTAQFPLGTMGTSIFRKTAATIREIGRNETDLSVELNEPKKQAKQANQEAQQNKEEEKDVVELQRKLSIMVKRVKDEQVKWKEEKESIHPPPPPPFFQEETNLRGIKMRVAVNIAFRGKFQSWLQDEYRHSNRAPPQHWVDKACKGENSSTCAKCPRCRIGVCMGGRWEKYFEGCSKCIHCNKSVASGNDEDWKTFSSPRTVMSQYPRAPEVENIKELTAAELSEGTKKSVPLVWIESARKHIGSQKILHEDANTYVVSKTESYKQELQRGRTWKALLPLWFSILGGTCASTT